MARVHFVKKARKDNSVVKAGESYYWWAFRYGGKHCSKTHPRPSQLTQSEYLSTLYGIQESIQDLDLKELSVSDVIEELEGFKEEVSDLGSECEEKIYNMPDALQDSETADLLRERQENCDATADSIDSAIQEIQPESTADEIRAALDGIDWAD